MSDMCKFNKKNNTKVSLKRQVSSFQLELPTQSEALTSTVLRWRTFKIFFWIQKTGQCPFGNDVLEIF